MMKNAAFILKHHALAIILCFGFLHGLVYVFIVPPWSHYDEPGHFEYVWMITTRPGIPGRGEMDAPIRREILASMINNGFYKSIGPPPDLSAVPNPAPIGVTQVGDPPVYYWLASLPVRLLRDQPIEIRLYAGRLVSLVFFLATIIIARKFGQEISSENSPLTWLIPFFVAALPSLVDVMTALNNDSAAIFVYSVFLLIGAKIIRRGLSARYAAALVICLIVGFFTKSSNWVLFIALPITLLLGWVRSNRTLLPWGVLATCGAALLVLFFQWDDPALWLRDTNQAIPTRDSANQPGMQGFALQISSSPQRVNRLYQALPRSQTTSLDGSSATFGVWMWADQPGPVYLPQVINIVHSDPQLSDPIIVQLTGQPQFFSYTFAIPSGSTRTILMLNPFEGLPADNRVYYYHPILAAGVFDTKRPPDQIDPGVTGGVWSGSPFTNLIRNPTGTGNWPRLRPLFVSLSGKIDTRLEQTLGWSVSLLDVKSTDWFLRASSERIFRTFWATFGWGSIPLMGNRPYRTLLVFTVIGLIGAVFALYRNHSKTNLILALWLGGNILFEFIFALYTGVSMGSITGRAFPPVARFIYPVILAISVILCTGWLACIRFFPDRFRNAGLTVLVSLFLVLDIMSIVTIRLYWIT